MTRDCVLILTYVLYIQRLTLYTADLVKNVCLHIIYKILIKKKNQKQKQKTLDKFAIYNTNR